MLKFLFLKKERISLPQQIKELLEKGEISLIPWERGLKDLEKGKIKPQGIMTLGGDGTLLKAIPIAYKYGLPILGVNKGKFGFLTEVSISELPQVFSLIKENEPVLKERVPLLVSFKGKKIPALNEVAILKGPEGKIIYLQVELNGKEFTTVYGDGLIIATPTGSTAYNLSAGGPVIHQEAPVMVCTPICSFKINLKPFVLPDSFKIKVTLTSPRDKAHILIDGQINLPFTTEDALEVSRASRFIKFFSLPEKDYLSRLKAKFKW